VYGYLGDAAMISNLEENREDNNTVSKNAVAVGIEAGYDIFSQIGKLHSSNQKLYLFGRYEYYN
jgi:hypothetical protein